MSRVVVVGAGLGGLAAAARLSRLRHDVVVVEAADAVGGQLGRATRDGFAWDTGANFVTLPAALRDLFLKTGKPLESVVELEPLEPLARLAFPEGTLLDLPNTGVHDVAAAFDDALGGGSGDAWRRFHAHAAEVWAATRGPLMESTLPPRGDVLRRPRLGRALAPRRTLRDVGTRFFSDPRQRAFVGRYALEVGADPRHAPSWLCVRPYVEQTFRGWTVRGGIRRLVDAVHDRAVERGADVRTGTRVVAVTTAGGRVDGVRLEDGEVLPADIVVSDADAWQLYGDLLTPDSSRNAAAPGTQSASVFTVLLGVHGVTPDVPQRTLLFPGDGDAELDAVFGERADVVDDPTMSVHVRRDSSHAPAGDEAWTIQVAAPRQGTGAGAIDWSVEGVAPSYAQLIVDRLAAHGLDVRDRVVVTEHRSPAEVESITATPGGAAYGTSLHGARAAWSPAANRSPMPGLFLVGATAHPGGGIPSVTMSAAIVAELVGRA